MQDFLFNMHLKTLAAIMAVCCAAWALFYTAASVRKPKTKKPKIAALIFLLLWISFIVFITLLSREQESVRRITTQPFGQIGTVFMNGNVLKEKSLNVMLFIPLGMFLASSFPRKMPEKSLAVLILSAALSCGIEYAQYKYMLGMADVDDIICNAAGGFIGYIIYSISAVSIYVITQIRKNEKNSAQKQDTNNL